VPGTTVVLLYFVSPCFVVSIFKGFLQSIHRRCLSPLSLTVHTLRNYNQREVTLVEPSPSQLRNLKRRFFPCVQEFVDQQTRQNKKDEPSESKTKTISTIMDYCHFFVSIFILLSKFQYSPSDNSNELFLSAIDFIQYFNIWT